MGVPRFPKAPGDVAANEITQPQTTQFSHPNRGYGRHYSYAILTPRPEWIELGKIRRDLSRD